MDSTKQASVVEYLQTNDIGVIIRYSKRNFANIKTGETFSKEQIYTRLRDADITTTMADVDWLLGEIEVGKVQKPKSAPKPSTDIIDTALTKIEIVLKSHDGEVAFFRRLNLIKIADVVAEVYVYILNNFPDPMSEAAIKNELIVKLNSIKQKEIDELGEQIGTDAALVPQSQAIAERLMRIVTGPKYVPMYGIVIRHMIWLMKRRYYRYSTNPATMKYPILLNFYSKESNTGKSSFVTKLIEVIPSTLKRNENYLKDLIDDERKAYAFIERLAIVCSELSGLDRADINSLKNIIDMDIISFRSLGFNSDTQGANHATLFGTSNHRLQEILRGGPDPRKWFEIPFHVYGDELTQHNTSYMPLQNFDYLSLWKSVDEKADTPLENPVYGEFRKMVRETCGNSEHGGIEDYLKMFILDNNGDVSDVSILKGFREINPYNRLSSHGLRPHMIAAGFVRNKKGTRWVIPSYEKSPLFTDKERMAVSEEIERESTLAVRDTLKLEDCLPHQRI